MRIVNRRQPFFGRQENTHTFLKEEDGLTSSPVKKNNQLILFPGYEGDLQTYLTDYDTFGKWCWTAQRAPRAQLLTTEGIGDNGKIVNFSILSGPPQIGFMRSDALVGDLSTIPGSGLTTYQDWDTTTTTQNLSGVAIPRVYTNTFGTSAWGPAVISTKAVGASGSGQFVIRATYGDYTEDQVYQLYNIGDDRYTILSKLYIGRAFWFTNSPAARCVTNAVTGLLKVCSNTVFESPVPNVPFTITVTSGYSANCGLVNGLASGGTIVSSFSATTSGWRYGYEFNSSDEYQSTPSGYGTRFDAVKSIGNGSNTLNNRGKPALYYLYYFTSGCYDFLLRNNSGTSQDVTVVVTGTNVYGTTISSTGYFTVLPTA